MFSSKVRGKWVKSPKFYFNPVLEIRLTDLQNISPKWNGTFDVYWAVHRNTFLQWNKLDGPAYQIILFWNGTVHVSDGLSVHHQEFKTVHRATGICQKDTADCLLQAVSSIWHMTVAVCIVLNSWLGAERPSEKCRVLFQNTINLRYWCILLVLL